MSNDLSVGTNKQPGETAHSLKPTVTCRECEHANMAGYIERKSFCRLTNEIITDIDRPPKGCNL